MFSYAKGAILCLGLLVLSVNSYAEDSDREHRMYVQTIKQSIVAKCNQSSGCTPISVDWSDRHIFIVMKDGGDAFSNDTILSDVAVALNRMNNRVIQEGRYKIARWLDVSLKVGDTDYFFDKALFVQYKTGKVNDKQFAKQAIKRKSADSLPINDRPKVVEKSQ